HAPRRADLHLQRLAAQAARLVPGRATNQAPPRRQEIELLWLRIGRVIAAQRQKRRAEQTRAEHDGAAAIDRDLELPMRGVFRRPEGHASAMVRELETRNEPFSAPGDPARTPIGIQAKVRIGDGGRALEAHLLREQIDATRALDDAKAVIADYAAVGAAD